MTPLPVLDLFILAALDREPASPYDLHQQLGISLGASLPALKRLAKAQLVQRTILKSGTRRPRHEYRIRAAGKAALASGWKDHMALRTSPDAGPLSKKSEPDLESVLRIVDLAMRYGGDRKAIRAFLKRAAARRMLLAKETNLRLSEPPKKKAQLTYSAMRLRCDYDRWMAESESLTRLEQQVKVEPENPDVIQLKLKGTDSD